MELASLITEVKDILPHLGEGYIEVCVHIHELMIFFELLSLELIFIVIKQKCLRRYNNDSASVINAVLEDSLPPDIKELDPTLPHIPPDPMVFYNLLKLKYSKIPNRRSLLISFFYQLRKHR